MYLFLLCPFLFLFHLTVTPTLHGRESKRLVNIANDLSLAKSHDPLSVLFLLDLCAAFSTARDDPLLPEAPFFTWFPGCHSSGFLPVSHNGPSFPLMVLPLPPSFLTLESPGAHSWTPCLLYRISVPWKHWFTCRVSQTIWIGLHLLSLGFASLNSQLP